MAKPKFSPGDLVELKSGGPTMTVEKLSGGLEPYYYCTWFSGAKHNKQGFSEESLKVAAIEE